MKTESVGESSELKMESEQNDVAAKKDTEQVDKEDDDDNEEEDQLLSVLGNTGRWQTLIILLTGLCCTPCSWHILIMTFMNAEVPFWCARPDSLANISVSDWRNISGQGEEGCEVLEGDQLVTCQAWEFDTSDFSSTITSEFGLVCGAKYLKSTAQTLYFVGMIVGVFGVGVLADMFGRKTVIVPLLVFQTVTGVVTMLMPTYELFLLARVVNSMGIVGIFEAQFSYMLEFLGGKWSTIWGCGMEFFWVLGWLSLGGMAYLLRDWRDLMLATSLPPLLGLVLLWLIPESPRWLLAKGRIEEAEEVVRSGAKFNGISLPDDWQLKPIKKLVRKVNMLDLFRTSNIRTKTLLVFHQWFVNSFAYYGLTMNISGLSPNSDVYLDYTFSGLLEIPSYTLSILFLLKYGRRVPYICSMLLCGVSLLIIPLLPQSYVMVAALGGKMCISFSWAVLFLYSAEIFPTQIRTTGIGLASFVGRFGGMLAPWVELLGKNYQIPSLTTTVFGLNALLAGLLAVWLPETADRTLPYTVEEAEKLPLPTICPWTRKLDKKREKTHSK